LIPHSKIRCSVAVEMALVFGLCTFLCSAISPVDDDVQQEALTSHRRAVCVHISKAISPTPAIHAIQAAIVTAIFVGAVVIRCYREDLLVSFPIVPETLIRPHSDRSPPPRSLSAL
jgi:hypothetical protein